MSFGFNQARWDTTEEIAVKEVVVKTQISELESGGATKILDIIADGKLLKLNCLGDIAEVFGRVNFKLLYVDKEGEIKGLDYFADFTESIQIEGLSGNLYCKIAVIDTDTSISGGIKLNCAVEITIYEVKCNEIRCLVDCDEKYYTEKSQIECQRFVISHIKSFPVTDDFDTNSDVMKILLSDAKCYVDNAVSGVDNVLVTGGVNASVTYLDDEQLRVANFNIPYSEELSLDGVQIGQVLKTDCDIKNLKVLLTGVEGSNIIRLEVEVEVTIQSFEQTTEEIVNDIFSVENELIEKRQEMTGYVYGGAKFYNDNIEGICEIDKESLPILNIVGVVGARNNVAQVISDDGKIIIEGVFCANILYLDDNGPECVEYEVPYSLPFNEEGVKKEDVLSAYGAVINVGAKLKREREIEVTAKLGFCVDNMVASNCKYIEEIEEGDKKDINQSVVSVFIAEEGESIWDAAKALSARPDDIKKQNPDLTEPLKEGDKIFYYRRINFEF